MFCTTTQNYPHIYVYNVQKREIKDLLTFFATHYTYLLVMFHLAAQIKYLYIDDVHAQKSSFISVSDSIPGKNALLR
jgi:hypothetical protein